jgi:hypothetical protein
VSERRVWSALNLTSADTDELYEDILQLNPFAAEPARALAAAVRSEAERLTYPSPAGGSPPTV